MSEVWKPGALVRYREPDADLDRARVAYGGRVKATRGVLKDGALYVVVSVDAEEWHTAVTLAEPGVAGGVLGPFNHTNFELVPPTAPGALIDLKPGEFISPALVLPRVVFEKDGMRVVEREPLSVLSIDSRVVTVRGRAFRVERAAVADALGQRGWEDAQRVSPTEFVEAILGLVEGEGE